MSKGYDNILQRRFPEGKLFSNAIFSLSVIEFCDAYNLDSESYADIVDRNINRILSQEALRIFNPKMEPKFGMFYNGWTLYVLNSYKENRLFKHSGIKEEILDHSSILEKRLLDIQRDSIQILNSYWDTNWPADNLIGIVAIRDTLIQNKWLDYILQTTEHKSGLIHHEGSQKSVIRGSSQAMISFCLEQMNYKNSTDYNQKFKDLFLNEYLGIQMVKENENGSDVMDMDSGPVLFGYGASATVMNIKTQASHGDNKPRRTWALMNTISLPVNFFKRKYYLFKKEPMFDMFMLWSAVELK